MHTEDDRKNTNSILWLLATTIIHNVNYNRPVFRIISSFIQRIWLCLFSITDQDFSISIGLFLINNSKAIRSDDNEIPKEFNRIMNKQNEEETTGNYGFLLLFSLSLFVHTCHVHSFRFIRLP